MQCTVDNCSKPSDYTFVWPWGASGECCQAHVVIVQQRARATRGRSGLVSFTRLNPDRVIPIERNERVELHTARLVAESERDDAHKRAAELFAVNTGLSNELRAARARVAQFEAQLPELNARIGQLLAERDAALVDASLAREEAERLGVDLRDRETPPEGVPAHVVE